MTSRTSFGHFARWLNLPTGVLIALLQRSPALKAVAALGEYVLASPAGTLLKGAFATAASLGAVHSLAGATTLSSTATSPAAATVNTPFSAAFTVLGTTSEPESWTVGGSLPPGLLLFNSATGGTGVGVGTVNAATLHLRGTPTTAGTFNFTLRANDSGGFMSPVFNFSIEVTAAGPTPTAPSITGHPASLTLNPGSTATFTVTATGSNVVYQWKKNGTDIAGATGNSLVLGGVGGGDAADYTVTVSNSAGSVTSRFARLVVAAPDVGRIINLSVRAQAGVSGPMTVGMVVRGGSKSILVRAIGPSLAPFGVTGLMADPKLEVFQEQTSVMSNDDWAGAQELSAAFMSVGAFPLANNAAKDAAVILPIENARTFRVTPATGSGGVALVEAYDAGTGNTARLINVSTLNPVGTGANVLVAGFVINGNTPKRLIIRAVGPALSAFGVPNVLADPKLEIHALINNVAIPVATNDDWGNDNQTASMQAAFAAVGAFDLPVNSKDAALDITLPAGAYTGTVSGINNGTGNALIEVYAAD